MDNFHLFELINASPGIGRLHLGIALLLARWAIWLLPLAMGVAWLRGDRESRSELLQLLLAVLLGLSIAFLVSRLWPQPRPFVLHMGTQYLAHDTAPGMPSDHSTVIWSLAFSALMSRRFAHWGFPLLALGLLVGLSRVHLGVHFPFDILAALPVALAGALAAAGLSRPLRPLFLRILSLYDRLTQRLHPHL